MPTQREIEMNGGVLVGHDGSKFSAHAVRWALTYARATGATLTVVRVWSLSTAPRPETWTPGFVPPLDDYAVAVLQALTADVAPLIVDAPEVSVSYQVVHGKSALRLIEASPRAAMLVVGRRGIGGFKGLLLGSVSTQIVNNAQCTVVVVKSEDDVHSAATRAIDEVADN